MITACFAQVFAQETLNGFMALGRPAWTEARQLLQRLLSKNEVSSHYLTTSSTAPSPIPSLPPLLRQPLLRDNQELKAR